MENKYRKISFVSVYKKILNFPTVFSLFFLIAIVAINRPAYAVNPAEEIQMLFSAMNEIGNGNGDRVIKRYEKWVYEAEKNDAEGMDLSQLYYSLGTAIWMHHYKGGSISNSRKNESLKYLRKTLAIYKQKEAHDSVAFMLFNIGTIKSMFAESSGQSIPVLVKSIREAMKYLASSGSVNAQKSIDGFKSMLKMYGANADDITIDPNSKFEPEEALLSILED
ncbi:hypothetical protein [Terasakiella pusilla]|uniref:hypothetical protein n=1 Tax=Terasakiella pusilla TaxID=64973 RepID=UPI003AA9A77C